MPYKDFNSVKVPLDIKAKEVVDLSINIDELSTLPPNINVYLEDALSSVFTLLNESAYHFKAVTAMKGTGRFYLYYSAQTLGVADSELTDDLRIYTTVKSMECFISGQLARVNTLSLYDLQGRLVMSRDLNPNKTEHVVDISHSGTRIYIVRLENDIKVKTQKIMIK